MPALVIVSLLALTACPAPPAAPPAVDTAAEEATLKAGTKSWFDSFNAGNVDVVVAVYADDVLVMPPGHAAITGKEATRAFLTTDIANVKAAGLVLEDGESTSGVSGELGWHSGSYTVKNASGEVVDSGSYMEVWRKSNGKWLIIRDIWNSSKPASPPPPGIPTS